MAVQSAGAVSTGIRSTQPVAIAGGGNSPGVAIGTSLPPAVATPPSQLIGNIGTYVGGAVGQVGASGTYGQLDSDIYNAAVASGLYTPDELAAIQEGSAAAAPNLGGSYQNKGGGNTAAVIASWTANIDNLLQPIVTAAASVPIAAPIGPGPNVPSNPGPLVPLQPPGGTTGNGPGAGVIPPTSGGGTGTGTSPPATDPTIGLLQGILNGIAGLGAPGTAASGTAPAAGDTTADQPISALGALQPIGTPTTTSSSGGESTILIVGLIVAVLVGVGIWFYEHHKKKGAPAPQGAR